MKSPITAPKHLIKRLLSKAGYEILPKGRFGLDALADIQTLLAHDAVKVVFDAGAHEGETMVEFRKRFPNADVHCFEPHTQAFDVLQLPSNNDPHVKTHNCALGDYDGWATLFCNARSHWNSLLGDSKDIERFVPGTLVTPIGTESVKVCRLDTFCRDHHIDRIDLLKLDVQGYELRVLNGASHLLKERKVRAIYSEVLFVSYYEGQCNFEDIFLYLKSHDYKFVGLYYLDHGRREDMSLLWCDAVFIA